MVKMADSATMRPAMPTRPRSGRFHVSNSSTAEAALMFVAIVPTSFVTAVRIFRMLQVPERPAALDDGDRRKVVRRRRRGDRPFERPRVPRIVAGLRALSIGNQQVDNEYGDGDRLDDGPDRDDEVQGVPAASWLVGVDAPRHPEQAGYVHHVECQVEADDEQPEMQFAETFAHQSSGDLRVPVIEGAEE